MVSFLQTPSVPKRPSKDKTNDDPQLKYIRVLKMNAYFQNNYFLSVVVQSKNKKFGTCYTYCEIDYKIPAASLIFVSVNYTPLSIVNFENIYQMISVYF